MLEQLSRLAECAATQMSRRRFLAQLGKSALVAAGATAALLALPRSAQARNSHRYLLCYYTCAGRPGYTCGARKTCPTIANCTVASSQFVSSCPTPGF